MPVLQIAPGEPARVTFDLLRAKQIPAVVDQAPVGTHSWSYWQDALLAFWPTVGAALGARVLRPRDG
jgi:S-formylglutathione hydrolase FrmB